MTRFYSAIVSACILSLCADAAGPTVSDIVVRQEDITVCQDSCAGMVSFTVDDADSDTLLMGIELSRDDGASWSVPLSSQYFMRCTPGTHQVRFSVPGQYGPDCRIKITVFDSLPRSGSMRRIPAAGHVFLMGSNNGRPEESPRHPVAFSRDFWIDTTEIRESVFKEFMPEYRPEYLGIYYYETDRPIDNCMWHWAILYCNYRSKQEQLDTCYTGFADTASNYDDFYGVRCDVTKNGYRLPTEAEWEYACRAGTNTQYFWGDDTLSADAFCWYRGNFRDTIHAVAKRRPNQFGLYDMTGGLLELCNDWYDSTYYQVSLRTDPTGPDAPMVMPEDPFRSVRGGFFVSQLHDITSSSRMGNFSSGHHPQTFRCVRNAVP